MGSRVPLWPTKTGDKESRPFPSGSFLRIFFTSLLPLLPSGTISGPCLGSYFLSPRRRVFFSSIVEVPYSHAGLYDNLVRSAYFVLSSEDYICSFVLHKLRYSSIHADASVTWFRCRMSVKLKRHSHTRRNVRLFARRFARRNVRNFCWVKLYLCANRPFACMVIIFKRRKFRKSWPHRPRQVLSESAVYHTIRHIWLGFVLMCLLV